MGREARGHPAVICWMGGRAFECYSYFHSTDFARQSLVRHRLCIIRVYTAVLYVERSGQLRLCLTPTASPGKSNLVNTTVDGQIPIGEGDHI